MIHLPGATTESAATHAPAARRRWRLLVSPPLPAAENMALDAALLARARETGETVLRVYSWERPTLSLGRNQRAAGAYSSERARELGVDVVRRPTGGRAVLHWREVTYCVAAPEQPGEPLRAAYARINRVLLDALHRLGVPASLARPRGRAPAPGLAPCFEAPVAGELVVDGRKLVGSAQYREAGALLQHGAILVDDDQPLLARLALVPLAPVPAPATLREVLGRAPSVSKVSGGRIPRLVTIGLGDPDISRSHVRLALEGDTVVVTDLHSRNGTHVAQPGKAPVKLRAGEPTPVLAGTVVDFGGGWTIQVVAD